VAAIPGITEQQADILVHHGFTSLEDLLQAEPDDLSEIEELASKLFRSSDAVRTEAARRQARRVTVMDAVFRSSWPPGDWQETGPRPVMILYARSYLRHREETRHREQGCPCPRQGTGHSRRQGSVEFPRQDHRRVPRK